LKYTRFLFEKTTLDLHPHLLLVLTELVADKLFPP